MTFNISRRRLIGTTSMGVTAAAVAGGPAVFAQDDTPTIRIGSKDFTESVLLGELISQLLEENGYEVERNLNLGGTFVAHEATVQGEIDTYIEYTGTGLIAILDQDLPDVESGEIPDEVYNIVSEAYPEEFGVEWLEPWGFNNTNAIAMRRADAEERGITKISDLEGHASELSIGTSQEAQVRDDGLPGLQELYGIEFSESSGLDPGLMYSAIDNDDVDVIMAFSTDGRIETMDLVLLEDDLGFFPPYYAAPVVRQDTLEAAPDLRDILNSVAGTLDDARMAGLNSEVDEDGREMADVARDFLVEEGLVEDGD